MTEYIFRPIEAWPGVLTPQGRRKSAPFSAPYANTLRLLSGEIEKLGARAAVIQLALGEGEIRLDGLPRASARPSHPGVIVAFESRRQGPLQFATDVFDYHHSYQGSGWQANLRAIALGLQALRAVDRYGITKKGEQYTGWKALSSGPPVPDMTAEEAAIFLVEHADFTDFSEGTPNELVAKLLAEPDQYLTSIYRRAARRLHPDLGGSVDLFLKAKKAKARLELVAA